MTLRHAVRVALAVGGTVDALVAVLAAFFQPVLGPLMDVPVHDALLATIVGSETAVVALVYVVALRDLDRFRPLLYLCALDQSLAAVVPALAIAHGTMIASVKTIAPIPGNLLLAAILFAGARRLRTEVRISR